MSYPIFHSQYTAAQIEGTIGKSPRIDPVTKHWEVWDINSGAYVDTGVAADAQDAATRAEAAATAAAGSELDAEAAATRAETAASTLVVESTLSTSSTNPVQNKVITEALDEKLNIDGYSALATVGNAEQLVSTVRVTDKAPYLFRPSGGAADIGNREYNKHVGGSVAHNQFVTNGDFSEGDGTYGWTTSGGTLTATDGVATYTITNAAAANNYMRASDSSPNARPTWYHGHKYLYGFTHRELNSDGTAVSSTGYIRFSFLASQQGWGGYTSKDWRRSYAVSNHANDNAAPTQQDWYAIRLIGTGSGPKAEGDHAEVKDVIIIDLTAMFGAEIADHIYTLETAEAGSGVEWLRTYGFLSALYYPRTTGALASVEATAHETVGFNQWDEEWELGNINTSTGQNSSSDSLIRCKNYIPVVPNALYFINTDSVVYFYDFSGNYISFTPKNNTTFTTPENCGYMRFRLGSAYGTVYKHDICVNLSWSGYRNGEYRPFVKHSYPLDDSVILRGRLVLDADGGLKYVGDTYAADGTVEREYDEVDLGTLPWQYYNADNGQSYFITNVQGVMKAPATDDDLADILPARALTVVSGTEMYSTYPDRTIAMQAMDGTITQGHLWIRWSELSDPADLVAALSGVMLSYPLATPTTEEAAPFQSPQIVDDFGTERYIVTAQDGFEMPVGHITEYPANLRDKLQHLPDLAENDGAYAIQQSGTQMSLVPLASAVPSVYDLLDSNPVAHRTIYRGKYLGETITPAQKAAIADGSFHDIWLGDYWGATAKLTIVDFDYWYLCGNTSFNKHHVVVMPAANMYSAKMNDSNTTAGGYYGSKMRGVEVDGVFTPYAEGCGLYNALLTFQSIFGDALLTHREYLSNGVTDGKESAGAWYDSIVDLPSEIMVYGSSIRTSMPRLQTINKSQLALMAAFPNFIFPSRATAWLRDVVSATNFALVYSDGCAIDTGAAWSHGVRPVAAIGG